MQDNRRLPIQACSIGLLCVAATLITGTARAATANRCGWVENPTPGNWSLKDRDGTWILSEQGGYTADGLDNLPDMTTRGWISDNGPHGYGCGCINVETGRDMQVTRVVSAVPLPVGTCRADRKLPRP